MKASEMIEALENLVFAYGDLDVAVDIGTELRPVKEVDMAAEEDNCFGIWF